ncbi:hypothetical protein GS610_10370 [Ruegeria sp. HKCCD6228]|uniref:FixH family protein n=1 Tax=unclassified Ruegeria TaxID=2625375 RepID=UPI001487AB6B|nr:MULTISPECIES: FixH family protein [unclassified Ruegeria]NOD97613.1 hypothetical protein [Ruegeria sp. HKCCD6228]
MIRWFFLFLALSNVATACETTGQRLSSETHGAPEIHLVVGDIPLAQPFSLQISICDEIAVDTVRVDAIMPAHRHGLNYAPEITELGDGLYRADGLLFHMPGLWEIRFEIGFNDKSVSYTSEVDLK